MSEVLFEGFDPPVEQPRAPLGKGGRDENGLSAGQRLTLRQRGLVRIGKHPLTRGPLHREASRDAEPGPRSDPFTCGSCVHRQIVAGGGNSYPKCFLPGFDGNPQPLRLTHGPQTDVRAWWPACPDYEAR